MHFLWFENVKVNVKQLNSLVASFVTDVADHEQLEGDIYLIAVILKQKKWLHRTKAFDEMASPKYKLSSYLTYKEIGTTVLRIIIYDQNVKNPENTEFFSPSFQKRNVLNWSPTWFSQIEFPIARIIPKHIRNPKIWNENRGLVKVNLNPKLVISRQSSTSKSKKLSFEKQVMQSSSYLSLIIQVKCNIFMLGTWLNILHTLSHWILPLTLWDRNKHYSHFTGQNQNKTEAQTDYITSLWSQS